MADSKPSSTSGSSHRGGSGNFAANPQCAAEVGRKGGENSHSGQRAASSERHGGNFAADRERASEAGRKGGRH